MSTNISQLYTSRVILLNLLKRRGFNIEDYNNFNFNDIRIMYTNKQLDMLLVNPTTKKKIYVKYHLGTKLRHNYVHDYIDDLFNLEEILEPNDDLIIISKDKVNDSQTKLMRTLFVKDNIFFTIFNLKQLQFNILEHSLVPPHTILNNTAVEEIKKKFNINNNKQFPEISRFDPVAMAIGLRPGQVCMILRPSKTAIETKYYRLCK